MTATADRVTRDYFWPSLNYQPHKAQQRIHADITLNRVVAAGRRLGKSQVGGHELIPEVFQTYNPTVLSYLEETKRRREFWIVGPNYSDSEKEFRVFYNDCKALGLPFDRPGTYYSAEAGSMTVSLWGGRFIVHGMSAAHPESLVGEGLCGVVMAEAAKVKEVVWTKSIRPTLADAHLNYGMGWTLWLSTPEGKNWFYEKWRNGQHGMQGWSSYRFPSWANTVVFPKLTNGAHVRQYMEATRTGSTRSLGLHSLDIDPEIVALLDEMSEERFNQEIAADFTEFVGRVFKAFDEEVHVRHVPWQAHLPTYGAVDYGWTNPFVWLELQVDHNDNVYVTREYYETEHDSTEHALALRDRGMGTNARVFYPDPEDPGSTNTLARMLRVRAVKDTGGPLNDRLNLIRTWLRPDVNGQWPVPGNIPLVGGPKLLIDHGCTNLIREMQDYRYPETKEEANRNPKDLPMDKDNHCPEALGRFFKGYFGLGSRKQHGTRIRRARITR